MYILTAATCDAGLTSYSIEPEIQSDALGVTDGEGLGSNCIGSKKYSE
jgi:hypothetical protein